MIELFYAGFSNILTPYCLTLMVLGTFVGIIFGAIPGLSSVMAIALFLPVTYGMEPGQGIAVLIALYISSVSGGLISAMLLKIPGTPASIATCFDGAPMVSNGQGSKAIGVGIFFSFLGTIISIVALIFISPTIAKIAIKFGPHEFFAIALFSLTLIATLSEGSMTKGIFSGVLGIAFATVGMAPIDGATRFTFGSIELTSGFNVLTVMIGLFAISEVIKTAETSKHSTNLAVAKIDMNVKGFGFSLQELYSQITNALRSAAIGLGIGILPGIGAGTSNLVSYSIAKNQSKNPEMFGTGCIDGIVASETANNASVGGALIPLMTLGIPGDGVTALLLGALMIHGIAPGPLLFHNHGDLVYTIFTACIVASVLMLFIEWYGMRFFAQVLKIPKHMLLPIVFVLCVVGAFALSTRVFDVVAVILFGVVGYLFISFKMPQAPFVIGFVLGGMTETNFRRALMLSDNSVLSFITNPISGFFILATVIVLITLCIKNFRKPKSTNKFSKSKAI